MDNGASSYRRFLDGDESAFDEIMKELFDNLVFFIDRYVFSGIFATCTCLLMASSNICKYIGCCLRARLRFNSVIGSLVIAYISHMHVQCILRRYFMVYVVANLHLTYACTMHLIRILRLNMDLLLHLTYACTMHQQTYTIVKMCTRISYVQFPQNLY